MSDLAVLLISHGTVNSVDELPDFLKNIRHGRPAADDVLAEVRRRYLAIGGKSPLNAISQRLAAKVEAKLGVPTRMSGRLWKPYPKDVLGELKALGAKRVAVVPLAQHSAQIYADAVKGPAAELGLDVHCSKDWGQTPELLAAYAARVMRAVDKLSVDQHAHAMIAFTAHSLPTFVIDAGDPYEREFRESVAGVVKHLPLDVPPHVVAFQSQGMSGPGPGGKPMTWLGPDLPSTMDTLATREVKHLLIAPIGFLADHVEILFDLDIEAKEWAKARGIELSRTDSLNDDDDLVNAIARVAKPLLYE